MTDKVQKIREEVERLKEWQPIASPSLNKLLSFIDSLQEEPVSEDLGRAAEKYAYELFPSIGAANTETELAFKAGGKWYKNKINRLVDRIDVNNHSYEELEDLYDALCEITK